MAYFLLFCLFVAIYIANEIIGRDPWTGKDL
jgi:hypothetical protein